MASASGSESHQRLAGKVAMITGAASGIGKAAAAAFVRNGAKVIIADVQDDLGLAVAAELGPDAAYVRCDVADEAQIAAAVDLAVERHGHLDIMFNNAGISGPVAPAPIGSLDLANFDRVMAVNARAVLAGVKHAARVMAPRRRGSILCTASVIAVLTNGLLLEYAISKATIIAVVRATAGQLARDGVRVNAISPVGIMTPLYARTMGEMIPGASEEELRRILEGKSDLAGAVPEVDDMTNAAVYLASDEAKYVTGHNLVVDGGYTAHKGLIGPPPVR